MDTIDQIEQRHHIGLAETGFLGSDSTCHHMQTHPHIAPADSLILLPPFDGFEFNEHCRYLPCRLTIESNKVIVPPIDPTDLGDAFVEACANSLKQSFSHFSFSLLI